MHVKIMEEAVRITRDGNSAWLLERIIFWFERATIRRDSKWWVANNIADWQEITNLSYKQLKTALAALRRQELIVCERHFWRQRSYLHITLTSKAHGIFGITHGTKDAKVKAQTGSEFKAQMGLSIYMEDNMEDFKEKSSGEPSLADVSPEPKKDLGTEMKVEDVLNAAKAKSQLHNPENPESLGVVWVKCVSGITESYIAPLKQKELGQLAHFRKLCPKDQAPAILRWVVSHWPEFAMTAQTEAGLKTVPSKPNIGFLLKHGDIAARCAVEAFSAPVKKPAAKVANASGSVQLLSQPDEAIPSPEEVQKIVWGD